MNPDYNRRIGEFIRTSRLKRGLPEPQVAQAVGYRHGGTIRRIENGVLAFPLARADQFADVLGMDRGEFWEKLGKLRMAGTLPEHTPSPSASTPLPRSIVRRLEKMKQTGEIWRKIKTQPLGGIEICSGFNSVEFRGVPRPAERAYARGGAPAAHRRDHLGRAEIPRNDLAQGARRAGRGGLKGEETKQKQEQN